MSSVKATGRMSPGFAILSPHYSSTGQMLKGGNDVRAVENGDAAAEVSELRASSDEVGETDRTYTLRTRSDVRLQVSEMRTDRRSAGLATDEALHLTRADYGGEDSSGCGLSVYRE